LTARLDLLVHGASSATRAARFPDDEALEAAALEALSGRVRPYGRVLTAPARAARETAATLGLDADIETALRDCDYGRWRGLALTVPPAKQSHHDKLNIYQRLLRIDSGRHGIDGFTVAWRKKTNHGCGRGRVLRMRPARDAYPQGGRPALPQVTEP